MIGKVSVDSIHVTNVYEYAKGVTGQICTSNAFGSRMKQHWTIQHSYPINVEGLHCRSQTMDKTTQLCVTHPMGTGPASSLMIE